MPSLTTSPIVFTTINLSSPPWHHIFGHSCERKIRHLSSIDKIKTSKPLPRISHSSSKIHKLPFTFSSIISKRPLGIIYSYVWGPAHIKSLDGYLYYLIFVDHFTKYIWLYPLKTKSIVSIIFPQFKAVVEKFFNLPILVLYSDNDREFIKSKTFLSSNGISHYITPPHTHELNATANQRHRHII